MNWDEAKKKQKRSKPRASKVYHGQPNCCQTENHKKKTKSKYIMTKTKVLRQAKLIISNPNAKSVETILSYNSDLKTNWILTLKPNQSNQNPNFSGKVEQWRWSTNLNKGKHKLWKCTWIVENIHILKYLNISASSN